MIIKVKQVKYDFKNQFEIRVNHELKYFTGCHSNEMGCYRRTKKLNL